MKTQLKNISNYCYKCRGTCWDSSSQKKTQENAQNMFGVIPNHCVNSANNVVKCPAALGLLK